MVYMLYTCIMKLSLCESCIPLTIRPRLSPEEHDPHLSVLPSEAAAAARNYKQQRSDANTLFEWVLLIHES